MKRTIGKFIAVILITFGASPSFAQTMYLDEMFNVSKQTNIVYDSNRSVNILFGQAPGQPQIIGANLRCDVYTPVGSTVTSRPTVIIAHTGNFLPVLTNRQATGNKDDSAVVEMCMRLARRGFNAVAVNYRLGWNALALPPASTEQFLKAIYRGMQDVRNAIRFLNINAVNYGIDTSKIIVGGQGTGGYIALALATIDKPSEINNIPKFQRNDFTPMVSIDTLGDWRGIGGNPFFNVSGDANVSSRAQMVFHYGGTMGDLIWLDSSSLPIVGMQSDRDPFAPFNTGNVILTANMTTVIPNASGAGAVVPKANDLGINAKLNSKYLVDPISKTLRAQANGVEQLYPVRTSFTQDAEPWEWWHRPSVQARTSSLFYTIPIPANGRAADSLSMLVNPDMSAVKARKYLDTIVDFVSRRIAVQFDLLGNTYDSLNNIYKLINPLNSSNLFLNCDIESNIEFKWEPATINGFGNVGYTLVFSKSDSINFTTPLISINRDAFPSINISKNAFINQLNSANIRFNDTIKLSWTVKANLNGLNSWSTDTFSLNIPRPINISLPDTFIAFKTDSLLLNAGSGYAKYLWSTGDTTQTIWAKNASVYKVTVQNSVGCSASDSTNVLFIKGIQQNDITICPNTYINLSIPEYIPTNGLVAWYPFNGNIKDESYLANVSANYGSVLTNDRFNNSNSAVLTSNGYILSSNVGLPVNDTFTISFWYNHISDFGIGEAINLGNESNTSWGALAANNRFCMNYGRGCGSTGSAQLQGTSNNNTWNHILYVSYGRNRLSKVYLNGVFIGNSNNANSSGFCSNAQLAIGRDRFADANFNGKLDDIAIWNRTLTQQEIQQTYTSGNNSYSRIRWSTNDTTNSIIVSPTNSTIYYCDITVGSYTFKDSVRVNVRALPNKSVNYNKLGLCKNDTITLNAASGYNYNWLKNDTIVGQSRVLNVLQAGAYRVALTDSFGCRNTSDTLRVFIAPLPKVSLLIKDTVQCLKENMFMFKDSTLLDSGTYNRVWNFGSGNTSTQMEPSFNFINTGNYSVKLTVTTNFGCKDSMVKVVTVNSNPTAGPMLGQTNALSVATPYIYTLAQQPNHTYNWTVTNGIIAAGQGTNAATVQWLNNGKGYLRAEVTNIEGCNDTTATQVTIGNVGLYEAGNIHSLMVYPNPSNGAFTVSLNALKSSTIQMSLINLLGQEIWNTQHAIQAGEQTIQINANLAPGVYTLRINNQEELVQHKVIIK